MYVLYDDEIDVVFWYNKQSRSQLLVLANFITCLPPEIPINPRARAKMAGIVNKVYSLPLPHAQNFAVELSRTYQIDLSNSTKQNILVIFAGTAWKLEYGTRLAWRFPTSVHAYPCYSIIANIQQETVSTCMIGWPNFFQVSFHVHPCSM